MNRFPIFCLWLPLIAYSLPQVGSDSGGAHLEAVGSELHIQTPSERTAIEWNHFSIESDEAVRFFQPSKNSAVLNNVVSGEISHLMGTLESKMGRVYIVNPSGIIIGKDAIINVGGLVASTLKITNEDFFQGKDHFFGTTPSKVINLGTIEASSGDVNVISYQVSNEGKILAPEGAVTLTAAHEAWLKPTGNKKVLIRTSVEAAVSEESGIINRGVVRALQTELDADGNIYKFAINHSGEIEATSLAEENGRLFIRSEHGTIKIAGLVQASGGHVEVLGKRVDVEGSAFIDVSHTTQAGSILMGGDWRGENTPFRSDQTHIGSGAFLRADGLDFGGGGKIVIWGNKSARFFGRLSAEGGAFGGDGGLIELSRVPLVGSTEISTRAPQGKAGTFLLDPPNITITTEASTTDAFDVNSGTFEFKGSISPINIQNTDIESLLVGNNVIIDTSNGTSTASGNGDITVGTLNVSDDPIINATTSKSLTFTASDRGVLQFNQSVHLVAPSGQRGGDINISANYINVGFIDKPTNNIEVVTKGESGASSGSINVLLKGIAPKLNIYSDASGKHSYLGSDYAFAENVGVYITEASGVTEGGIEVTSGAGESKIYTTSYSNTYANPVDITLNSNPGSEDLLSIEIVTRGSDATACIESNNPIQINVPGTISLKEVSGGDTHILSSDFQVGDADSIIKCHDLKLDSAVSSAYIKKTTSNNANKLLITASGSISLINQSELLAEHDLLIDSAPDGITLTDTGGEGSRIVADNQLEIKASTGNTIGPIILKATSGNETESALISQNHLEIVTSESLTLNRSTVQTQASMNVSVGSIDVNGGSFYTGNTSNSDITLTATSGSITCKGDSSVPFVIGAFAGASPSIELTAQGSINLSSSSTDPTDCSVTGATITATAATGSINLSRAKLDAKTGDIKLIAGQNVTFASGSDLIASYSAAQSVFIVADQLSPPTGGIGHIETDASTQFTLNSDESSRLQLFCGFFENNKIDPATNFNGATFTGKLDVPDDYNHYSIVYDPTSLPTLYTAPYGFYYKEKTPYHKIQQGVYTGALDLSSSKVSQDSALTELVRQLRDRGTPQIVHPKEPQESPAPASTTQVEAESSKGSPEEPEPQEEAPAVQEKQSKNSNLL